jgi:hypothetical protein
MSNQEEDVEEAEVLQDEEILEGDAPENEAPLVDFATEE